MISFFIFILGTLIGSFLNVIILRLPKNESIITPRSHCLSCKKKIPFYLNIPIISYLLLKGKCNQCNSRISPQYIIVETITGILFYTLFINLSTEVDKVILLSLIYSCLIIISFIDMHYLLIPSLVIFLLLILLIPYSFIFNISINKIIWGGVAITSYLGGSTLLVSVLKKEGGILGLGDILLSLFIGGYLGIVNGLFCLFLASILGLFYALFLKSKLSKDSSTKIPFGTCLSLSFIAITLLEICIDFRLTLF